MDIYANVLIKPGETFILNPLRNMVANKLRKYFNIVKVDYSGRRKLNPSKTGNSSKIFTKLSRQEDLRFTKQIVSP